MKEKNEVLAQYISYIIGGKENTLPAIRPVCNVKKLVIQILNEIWYLVPSVLLSLQKLWNFTFYFTDVRTRTFIFDTDVVEDMKRRGIEFYTIGTGDSPNVGELGDIATDPDSEHEFRSVHQLFFCLNFWNFQAFRVAHNS